MAVIAQRAGVHTTTVSLALRNHPSLPVATRERLQTLAKQMGYRPDPALAALVAYRTGMRPRKDHPTIAYVTNWNTRWGWKKMTAHAQFFAGAAAKAPTLGFKLEHFWLGEDGLRHERLSDMLYARGITGIVVASHRQQAGDELRFDWDRFSSVKIDFFPHQPAIHTVTNDQRALIQLAMQRTMAAGYRRIGFLIPHAWDKFVDLAWSAGFLAQQQSLPAKDRIPILSYPDSTPVGSRVVPRADFEGWYRKYRPEVLIGHAPFLQPRLKEAGLSIPRNVAFVEIFLEDCTGRTAGIRHNCHRVGELAVEILVGQLHQHTHGVPAFPTTTLVEGTWFDGTSLPKSQAPKHAG